VKLKEDLLNKKKRLTKAEREYKELCRIIEDLTKNDKMLKGSEEKYEQFLKDKAKIKNKLEKDIKIKEKEYLKVSIWN
jgi:hypothetical protein